MKFIKEISIRSLRGKFLLVLPSTGNALRSNDQPGSGLSSGQLRGVEVNATFAALWEAFSGRVFSVSDIAEWLKSRYGIDDAQAAGDARQLAEQLRTYKLVEE